MIHFYCFHSTKTIVVSDLPVEKVRSKFGIGYEILNSIKDKEHIEIIVLRVLKSHPGFTVEYFYQKPKKPLSEEARRKISLSKLGKPRDAATRAKLSAKLKGRSNFQGKRHNIETKEKMAEKKLGNQHTKNYYWVHDPRSDTEKRVPSLDKIPDGFSKGRDYYSTEAGFYHFKEYQARGSNATNSPTETLPSKDPQSY